MDRYKNGGDPRWRVTGLPRVSIAEGVSARKTKTQQRAKEATSRRVMGYPAFVG
jgi:hypothetical protein